MSERLGVKAAGPVLILTPTGRDGEGAARLLATEGIESIVHRGLNDLQISLDDEVGLVLLADEALFRADLSLLSTKLSQQPPWSDLPFIVLTQAGIAARRQLAELNLPGKLGNVLFLERPLNSLALISAVKSSLRARMRQRQVRQYLTDQAGAAERAQAELEARVQERTKALEAAEAERQTISEALSQAQKMEAVGQLTGGLAHDFNNMLAGVSGSLELLQRRLAQGRIEELGRYISMAQLGAQRAASLTHRLLAFSRRQMLDARPTGTNGLVEGMIELIRSTIGPAVTIETRMADDLWLTLCDPHQLENAILNLAINARDAMPDGGQLTIETSRATLTAREARAMREAQAGDYVLLSVTDTGFGMSEETMARAFDPFFTTKPTGQGTGLGLSMAYGFVQQSGGHVQIRSRVGHGTTVQLFLPRYDGIEERNAATANDDVLGGNQETVLVVDDEPTIRLLVREVLSELSYIPLEASDGPKALAVLRSAPRVDLLVTDVGMPGGMNGRQLADAAREQRPDLKILFITGYAETALALDGVLPEGMQVLTKPFSIDELGARLQAMLSKVH